MLEPTVRVWATFYPYTQFQTCPGNILYFGCRSASKDQHFGDEWRSYEKDQHLQYRTAFSRDGPEGVKRIYVQDLICADAEQIWRLVGEQKGWVLISG